MEDKFEELYNKILDGGNWDYSTLDELLSLSELEGYEKGKTEMKERCCIVFRHFMSIAALASMSDEQFDFEKEFEKTISQI